MNANVLINVYHDNELTLPLTSRIQIKSLHKRNRAPPFLALVSPLNDEVYAPFCVKKENKLVDVLKPTNMGGHPVAPISKISLAWATCKRLSAYGPIKVYHDNELTLPLASRIR